MKPVGVVVQLVDGSRETEHSVPGTVLMDENNRDLFE